MKTHHSNIELLVIVFLTAMVHSVSAQDYNVYFDFDSYKLRINDVVKLHKIPGNFNSSIQTIFLVGHTDTVGNDQYNLNLSQRRTNTVEKYLISIGINPGLIKKDNIGKKQPATSVQFYNRRVELYIKEKADFKISFENFRTAQKPKVQKFKVKTDVAIEFEGARGTIVSIPPNAFLNQSGKVAEGEVEINLTEFYSIKDFFSEKLSTISNDDLLSSAGMAYIKVLQNESELQLKPGTEIELGFPKTNENEYSTFYGERQKDGSMNWNEKEKTVDDNIGFTVSEDGNSLIETDRKTADEKNKNLGYNASSGNLVTLTKQEKEAFSKYFEEVDKENQEPLKELYFEQEKINKVRENYYFLAKSKKLGYINCDRYLDPKAGVINIAVKVTNPDVVIESASLMLRKYNSYVEMVKIKSGAMFSGKIFLRGKVELIVLGTKKDVPYFYKGLIDIKKDNKVEIELGPTSYEKIKEMF